MRPWQSLFLLADGRIERNQMSKETLKTSADKAEKQVFYLPEFGVTVEATSLEEAIKKATKGDQENGN